MNFLQAVSNVAGPGYEDRDVTLPNGTLRVRCRKLLAGEAEALFATIKKDGANRGFRDRIVSSTISTFVKNDAGEEVEVPCTKDEAPKLPNEVCVKLFDLALEINGVRDEKKSDPEGESASGTS